MLAIALGLLAIRGAHAEPTICSRDVAVPQVDHSFVDVHGFDRLPLRYWVNHHAADLRTAMENSALGGEARSRLEADLRERSGMGRAKLTTITYHGEKDDVVWTFSTFDVWDSTLTDSRFDESSPADPDGLVAAWQNYESTGWQLARQGAVRPVPECGELHCLFGFDHPALSGFRAQFDADVPRNADQIAQILVRDPAWEHRAAAAFLLGHMTDAGAAVAGLLPGLSDPDARVRNNVIRVLGQVLRHRPDVEAPIDVVLDALVNLPTVTDRNKLLVLVAELASRDRAIATRAVARAGPEILEGIRLSQPNNREPALAILTAVDGGIASPCALAPWRRLVRRVARSWRPSP